jgi:hypothetical protein
MQVAGNLRAILGLEGILLFGPQSHRILDSYPPSGV